jgi:hypothetical protein
MLMIVTDESPPEPAGRRVSDVPEDTLKSIVQYVARLAVEQNIKSVLSMAHTTKGGSMTETTETDAYFVANMVPQDVTGSPGAVVALTVPQYNRLLRLATRGAAVPDLIGARLLRDDRAVIKKDTSSEAGDTHTASSRGRRWGCRRRHTQGDHRAVTLVRRHLAIKARHLGSRQRAYGECRRTG